MDKYEILAKNLEDNGVSDERERQYAWKAGYIAMVAMLVTATALFILNQFFKQPSHDIQAIIFTSLTAMIAYQYIVTRRKLFIFFGIFSAIGAIGSITYYLIQLIG